MNSLKRCANQRIWKKLVRSITLGDKLCLKEFSNKASSPRICIVGSGPAGFGLAQHLLKNHDKLTVDMVEKLPIPYGLVRYGVSPDHQDVKNCIHGYDRFAENNRFFYFGNIEIGKTLSVEDLSKKYDAVALCTGAQGEQLLNVPGVEVDNIFSANKFVGWYNGLPEYRHVRPDLSGTTAVIVGVGNVALDCARMLLKPHEDLKSTDITKYSYEALMKSNIRNVVIVGRRGPLQMACTRKELAEITELSDVTTIIDKGHFTEVLKKALKVKDLKLRKTQRLVKHLMKCASSEEFSDVSTEKQFMIKLLRTPVEIVHDSDKLSGIILKKNELGSGDPYNPEIIETENLERINCNLLISCIGYRNQPLCDSIPFKNGRIENTNGRISSDFPLYACGWCKTGPKGVLADTLNDCVITGDSILADLNTWGVSKSKDPGFSSHFSWNDWKTLDNHETKQGELVGKIREKVTSISQMFDIVAK